MSSFTNLAQLEAHIRKSLDVALNTEVAETVKDNLQTAVSTKVYGWGTPSRYIRRNLRNGSLGDPNEMRHVVSNNSLEVWDEAKSKRPWDRELPEAIVHGYGDQQQPWNEARDFIEEAREILREDQSHVSALRDALVGMGFEVV